MQAGMIPRVESRNFTVKFTVTGIASGFECVLDGMEHIDHRGNGTLQSCLPIVFMSFDGITTCINSVRAYIPLLHVAY